MHDQVFADGLGQISVIGGTVRLDFVAFSPVEKEPSGRPVAVLRQQLIMPVDAFVQAAEKMHEAANALASRAANLRPREPHAVVEAQVSTPQAETAAVTETVKPAADAPKAQGKPPFP